MRYRELTEKTNTDVVIKKQKGGIYNAYLNGVKVGQAQVYDYTDSKVGENERYIWKSSVDPALKRQGIASAIYNVIAADLESRGLKLVPSPDQQLSSDAYQFWKARDPESVKGHGTFKAAEYQHFVGKELVYKNRPVIVTRVGWGQQSNAPLLGVRYTDVPEGSVNSTSYINFNVVADQLAEDKETLNPPSIDVGDEVKTGKFKNSKATVKGFKKDDHGQPVLKTNKGDKKLFNLRLSKLQETYQYAMRDEEFFTHEEYEKAQAELTAMGGGMYPSKAVREKYKPFGKLGTTTKPEQVMQHQLAGINKHDWAFSAQYSGYSEQECRICGKRRKVSAKGHDIRR